MRRPTRRRDADRAWLGVIGCQVADPAPAPDDDAVKQARFEADQAKAEAARLKREMDEIKKQLPTPEQQARYAELEEQHRKAEEERLAKKGEFDEWRTQLKQKTDKEIEAERAMREEAERQRVATNRELDDTLIGREFADATELFGPTGKTVLMPDIAQAYFASHVEVQAVPGVNGGPAKRRVIVKDAHGVMILDTKSGQPAPFAKAMAELIDAHPRKNQMLRGSMKVGAGSSGGAHGGDGGIDTTKLKPKDFEDAKVRDAVRSEQASAGGLQMGPAFDRMKKRDTK